MKRFKTTLIYGVCIFSFAGCANDKNLSLGVDDACTSLTAIAADYVNGFEEFRGSGSNYSSFTLYTAKKELVKGHCEIWEWAGGDRAYVCSASTPINEVAAQRYSVTKDFVQTCIGNSWQKEEVERERDGEYLGQATNFSSSSAPGLVISVQYNTPPKAYRQLRNNVLYIGSEASRPNMD